MGKRAKVRVGVTIQLVKGEDDDLIEAIEALPDGSRQSTIKNLLRQSYGLPIPEPSTNGYIDLDSLRQSIYQDIMNNINAEIQQRVEQSLDAPRLPTAPPPVEAGDVLDNQTANERVSRLKRANW